MEETLRSSEVTPQFICTVGNLLDSSCKNFTLTREKNVYIIFETLTKQDLELLTWRTNGHYIENDTICSHHLCYFLKYFEKNQKVCCDPLHKHAVHLPKKSDLRVITLQKAKDAKINQDITLVPGKLLCSACRKSLSTKSAGVFNEETAQQNSDEDNSENLHIAKRVTEKDHLNETLAGLDVTPLKLQSLSTHSKKIMPRKSSNKRNPR